MPPMKSACSSICIFCFGSSGKNWGNGGSEGGGDPDKTVVLRRFFTMVQRYFQEKTGSININTVCEEARRKLPEFLEMPEEFNFGSCPKCFQYVESYCDIYHKMKCLELELDKLVDNLKTVMTEGNKQPPTFSGVTSWSPAERMGMQKSMAYRGHIQKHCELGSLEVFPRISTSRVQVQRNKTQSINQIVQPIKVKRGRGRPPKNSQAKATFYIPPPISEPPLKVETRPSRTTAACIQRPSIKREPSPSNSPIHDDHFDDDWLPDDDIPMETPVPVDVREPVKVDNRMDDNDDYAVEEDDHQSTSDEDWNSDEDDIKTRRKKKMKKPTIISASTLKRSRGRNIRGNFECSKCPPNSRPTFNSTGSLQIHQNYLHTNGCISLNKSDTFDILHLSEDDLKLDGVNTTLKFCSIPLCPKQFMLLEELSNHQKYHGHFTCDACPSAFSDAIILTHHAISHFKESGLHNSDDGVLTCGICLTFTTPIESELINHYLETHLELPKISSTCPICQLQFENKDKVPFIHYLNYHDLNRLEDPSSGGVKCLEDSCSAYFLTEDQLQTHFHTFHTPEGSQQPPKKKRRSQAIAIKLARKANRYLTKDFEHCCEFCPKKFRADYELRDHIWTCHADEKLGMDSGKIQLTDNLTVDDFINEEEHICTICDKILSSDEQLQRHLLHHGEFPCQFCDVVKTLATELAVHETVHKIEKNPTSAKPTTSVNCPRCSYSTAKRMDYIDHHLEVHLKIPSERKRCPICWKPVAILQKKNSGPSKTLKTWVICHYMEQHDRTGLEPETMPKCDLCPGYFRTPIQFHNHSRDIHGNKTIHQCMDCGKDFSKMSKLRNHRVSKHKVDESSFQFFCSFPECKAKFERQIELDYHEGLAHLRKDDGIQVCPKCEKRCVGMNQLKTHLKAHEAQEEVRERRMRRKKEKNEVRERVRKEQRKVKDEGGPYICDQCGKSHDRRDLLLAHIRRHRGSSVYNFSCGVCGRRCATRYKLKLHEMTHTKEKRFVCQFCGKACSTPYNLNAHVRTVHEKQKREREREAVKQEELPDPLADFF